MVGAKNAPLPLLPTFFKKNMLILFVKTPQFKRIMAFFVCLFILLLWFSIQFS